MSTAAVIAAARAVLQTPTHEALDSLSAALRDHDEGLFEAVGYEPTTRVLTGQRGSVVIGAQAARVLHALIVARGGCISQADLAMVASQNGAPVRKSHLRWLGTYLRDKFAMVNSQAQIIARKNDGYVLLAPQMDTAP